LVCFTLVAKIAGVTCSVYDCDSMESTSVSLHVLFKDVKLLQKLIHIIWRHCNVPSKIPEKWVL